jgi:hypothetical protein
LLQEAINRIGKRGRSASHAGEFAMSSTDSITHTTVPYAYQQHFEQQQPGYVGWPVTSESVNNTERLFFLSISG